MSLPNDELVTGVREGSGPEEDRVKKFSCGDVVPGCEAQWVCSTEDEILVEVASHARTAHGMAAVPDDLVAQVRSRIVTPA